MKKLLFKIIKRCNSFVDSYESNVYISCLKDVIVSIGFPMVLIGSLFFIAANPPRGTDFWLFRMWLSAAVETKDALMVPYYFTCGIVSIAVAFALSYRLSFKFSTDPILSPILSTSSFLILNFAGEPSGSYSLDKIFKITGPNGILTAFIVSILCIKLLAFFNKRKLYFNIKSGISPSLSLGMKNMFPVMIILPFMWICGWTFGKLLDEPLQVGITSATINIIASNSGLIEDITGALGASLLYLIGMDGSMIKQPVYNVFMNQGGFGTLLPLTVLFILSCSKHLTQVGKSVLIPSIFNVSYPVIFAAPVILNPVYLLPFILYPLLSTVINHFILSTGFLSVTVEASYTMPVLFSGYFSTAGEIIGVLLQIFNFVLSLLVYYPFFLYHESRLIRLHGGEKEFKIAKKGSSLQK